MQPQTEKYCATRCLSADSCEAAMIHTGSRYQRTVGFLLSCTLPGRYAWVSKWGLLQGAGVRSPCQRVLIEVTVHVVGSTEPQLLYVVSCYQLQPSPSFDDGVAS